MTRLLTFYESDEMFLTVRLSIIDAFNTVAKNIGLRRIFLRREFVKVFVDKALKILDEQERKRSSRFCDLYLKTIELLIVCCNV